MKRILFAISIVLLSFSIIAQNKSTDNIPSKVKSELKKHLSKCEINQMVFP